MICFQEYAGSVARASVIGAVTTLESAANMCLESKVPIQSSQTPFRMVQWEFGAWDLEFLRRGAIFSRLNAFNPFNPCNSCNPCNSFNSFNLFNLFNLFNPFNSQLPNPQ